MSNWLVKSEPGCWSWDDHVKVGTEPWDGVRNHQAANYMRAMKVGERVFFYHSVNEKRIVGTLKVTREAYIDPTDPTCKFVCIDLTACQALKTPVTLAQIKANPALEEMPLLRQSRLSVCPVTDAQWSEILAMAGGLIDD